MLSIAPQLASCATHRPCRNPPPKNKHNTPRSISDEEQALIRLDPEAAAANRALLDALSARTGYSYGEVRGRALGRVHTRTCTVCTLCACKRSRA